MKGRMLEATLDATTTPVDKTGHPAHSKHVYGFKLNSK